jgi:hypothetical protein
MVQHCANTITAGGIGNGSTLVICMGIITGAFFVFVLVVARGAAPPLIAPVSRACGAQLSQAVTPLASKRPLIPQGAPRMLAPAEYADTMHAVLAALESATLPPLRLAALLVGYLGLVLFTVYLSSAEVRLPMVQYSSTPPQVRGWSTPGGGVGLRRDWRVGRRSADRHCHSDGVHWSRARQEAAGGRRPRTSQTRRGGVSPPSQPPKHLCCLAAPCAPSRAARPAAARASCLRRRVRC